MELQRMTGGEGHTYVCRQATIGLLPQEGVKNDGKIWGVRRKPDVVRIPDTGDSCYWTLRREGALGAAPARVLRSGWG